MGEPTQCSRMENICLEVIAKARKTCSEQPECAPLVTMLTELLELAMDERVTLSIGERQSILENVRILKGISHSVSATVPMPDPDPQIFATPPRVDSRMPTIPLEPGPTLLPEENCASSIWSTSTESNFLPVELVVDNPWKDESNVYLTVNETAPSSPTSDKANSEIAVLQNPGSHPQVIDHESKPAQPQWSFLALGLLLCLPILAITLFVTLVPFPVLWFHFLQFHVYRPM